MTKPLLSFYGDDFTGSTDALEALSKAGLKTVLFLGLPRDETLKHFDGVDALGIAGMSRAMSPSDMKSALPPAFERLRSFGAPVVHYKVCSTFDSSPEVGSIGCAIDLGQEMFQSLFVPLVVGAPVLGRYCVFGNLFARSGLESEPYRLDRHPTMRHHPVTPMDEADIRLHLAKQTDKRIALVDVLNLASPEADMTRDFGALLEDRPDIVLFDTLEDAHLPRIGKLIWHHASPERPLFTVGSSGVEYALSAYWREAGTLPGAPSFDQVEPIEPLLVISGSCSPVTAKQIERALEHGFASVALSPEQLVDPATQAQAHRDAVQKAVAELERGKSVIVHTCLGPNDPRLSATRRKITALGRASSDVGRHVGSRLGHILRDIQEVMTLQRVVVAGGDTSGYVAAQLGIEALEVIAPFAPGSPLCRAYAPASPFEGLDIVFKGGQVGWIEFFVDLLHGHKAQTPRKEGIR